MDPMSMAPAGAMGHGAHQPPAASHQNHEVEQLSMVKPRKSMNIDEHHAHLWGDEW